MTTFPGSLKTKRDMDRVKWGSEIDIQNQGWCITTIFQLSLMWCNFRFVLLSTYAKKANLSLMISLCSAHEHKSKKFCCLFSSYNVVWGQWRASSLASFIGIQPAFAVFDFGELFSRLAISGQERCLCSMPNAYRVRRWSSSTEHFFTFCRLDK